MADPASASGKPNEGGRKRKMEPRRANLPHSLLSRHLRSCLGVLIPDRAPTFTEAPLAHRKLLHLVLQQKLLVHDFRGAALVLAALMSCALLKAMMRLVAGSWLTARSLALCVVPGVGTMHWSLCDEAMYIRTDASLEVMMHSHGAETAGNARITDKTIMMHQRRMLVTPNIRPAERMALTFDTVALLMESGELEQAFYALRKVMDNAMYKSCPLSHTCLALLCFCLWERERAAGGTGQGGAIAGRRRGWLALAEKHVAKARRSHEEHLGMAYLHAKVMLAAGDVARARRIITDAAQKNPTDPDAHRRDADDDDDDGTGICEGSKDGDGIVEHSGDGPMPRLELLPDAPQKPAPDAGGPQPAVDPSVDPLEESAMDGDVTGSTAGDQGPRLTATRRESGMEGEEEGYSIGDGTEQPKRKKRKKDERKEKRKKKKEKQKRHVEIVEPGEDPEADATHEEQEGHHEGAVVVAGVREVPDVMDTSTGMGGMHTRRGLRDLLAGHPGSLERFLDVWEDRAHWWPRLQFRPGGVWERLAGESLPDHGLRLVWKSLCASLLLGPACRGFCQAVDVALATNPAFEAAADLLAQQQQCALSGNHS
eukprot:jgi/Mesvir1/5870/Mv00650-RA.1